MGDHTNVVLLAAGQRQDDKGKWATTLASYDDLGMPYEGTTLASYKERDTYGQLLLRCGSNWKCVDTKNKTKSGAPWRPT